MDTIISNSPEETQRLGEGGGREARPGWIIGLSGDLGSGKTQLVKGIARGLGIVDRVSSPTFGLVNELEGGRLPFAHLDLYRLERLDEMENAGLMDYLMEPSGLVVVEWVERCWPGSNEPEGWMISSNRLRWVRFETTAPSQRRIQIEDFGNG